MPSFDTEGGAYEVHNSTAIAEAFLRLQSQATQEGRGEELLRAAKTAYERLRQDPYELGEPLYRLPALRMQVRSVAISPLVVHFAVCEDRPLVIISAVGLLSARSS